MHFKTKKKVQHCNNSVSDRSKQSSGLKFPFFPLQVRLRSWLHVTRRHCRSSWSVLEPWSREKKSWSKRYHAHVAFVATKLQCKCFLFICTEATSLWKVDRLQSEKVELKISSEKEISNLWSQLESMRTNRQELGGKLGYFPLNHFLFLNISIVLDFCIFLLVYYL